MKKIIIILLFIPLVSYSQWTSMQQVDEFGDSTGEQVWTFQNLGKFSNSAQVGAEATLAIALKNNLMAFAILEYNSNPASFLCDNINIAIKTESGKVYRENLRKHYTTGVYNITTYFDYEYGDKYFYLKKPDARRMKWIQKNRKKGLVDFYQLLTTSTGKFKMAITCGQSKYNFDVDGFYSKDSE